MRSPTRQGCLSLVVLLISSFAAPASADPPSQALDAYVKAYTQMGKNAAVIFSQENTRANARTNVFKSWVDAQCKILKAKGDWITSVANANGTNAKTLETLQQVRGLTLDNNLKTAKTFYEKRKLNDGYQGLNTQKRPTQEDAIRYGKAMLPGRPASYELEPARGRIYWPEVLLDEEFADCRIRLNGLFAQRKAAPSFPSVGHEAAPPNGRGSNVSRQVQTAAVQMRQQLRSKIRGMTPTEYMAARKFLEKLAHEARFPARIEGVASK